MPMTPREALGRRVPPEAAVRVPPEAAVRLLPDGPVWAVALEAVGSVTFG